VAGLWPVACNRNIDSLTCQIVQVSFPPGRRPNPDGVSPGLPHRVNRRIDQPGLIALKVCGLVGLEIPDCGWETGGRTGDAQSPIIDPQSEEKDLRDNHPCSHACILNVSFFPYRRSLRDFLNRSVRPGERGGAGPKRLVRGRKDINTENRCFSVVLGTRGPHQMETRLVSIDTRGARCADFFRAGRYWGLDETGYLLRSSRAERKPA